MPVLVLALPAGQAADHFSRTRLFQAAQTTALLASLGLAALSLWQGPIYLIYLLEESIIMQVRGGKEVTLTPGETFYEGPDDVHVVGRNASQTKPAKFVVFFLKDKGAPVLVHAK